MTGESGAIEVAVFAPLRNTFSYRACAQTGDAPASAPGQLVRVPFGRGERVGVILGPASSESATKHRLKPIKQVLYELPIIDAQILRLARWAADYYQHPLGDVIAATLPGTLRRGRAPVPAESFEWVIREPEKEHDALLRRAPRQAMVLDQMRERPAVVADFESLQFDWRRALRELEKKGLVQRRVSARQIMAPPQSLIQLNPAQEAAALSIFASLGSFNVNLLHGVTGSGKTEVYLAVIRQALDKGLTTLMLVPEIILTQQMVARLRQAFASAVGVLHSGMSDAERAQVWLGCQRGEIKILMGTRSAVWAPLLNAGIIIVDEEHDASFKQHEGFRYNARDVAIKRAQQLSIPIVLGTATPSLETYLNVKKDKYAYLSLPERAGVARLPSINCIDVRGQRLNGGMSAKLCHALRERLERKEQSILFLNRRGFAPVILCHQCGHITNCSRCDAKLVWHKQRNMLVCHHCGRQMPTENIAACCAAPDVVPIGLGTEQVEVALNDMFPEANIARIDRDSMRRKNAIEETFAAIRGGKVDILIGTQMLAKGHDFSRVSLVGIVDADAQLFSADFRAEEKLAQMIIQVAGRAGRAELPGEVLIQTHHPHHELLRTLMDAGYEGFAEIALEERRQAQLPPYVPMALIRAESLNEPMPLRFLSVLAEEIRAQHISGLEILGPIPAAMEKRAGRFRAQLMMSASTRRVLANSVKLLIECGERADMRNSVRWSIDIDPQDTL